MTATTEEVSIAHLFSTLWLEMADWSLSLRDSQDADDSFRYTQMAQRLQRAEDYQTPELMAWAREWYDSLKDAEDRKAAQEAEAEAIWRAQAEQVATQLALGKSTNKYYQAWLSTLESLPPKSNIGYFTFMSECSMRLDKKYPGLSSGRSDIQSAEYHEKFDVLILEFAEARLSERVRKEREAAAIAVDPSLS